MKVNFLLAAVGTMSLAVASPASADIIWATGNIQYDNVNIVADTDALSVLGDIGNTGKQMTFDTMIGPDFSTQVSMHCQHGVAFCESSVDSTSSLSHTGFSSLTLTALGGTTWDKGDFALDQLAGQADGTVTFLAYDALGNLLPVTGTNTFAMSVNGQNQYNFVTQNGEVISKLVISSNDPTLMQDIKQVSLEVTGFPVPEPVSLLLFGSGLVGLGLVRRRKAA